MKKDLLILIALCMVVAASYSNSLFIPFVYDDHAYIVQNGFIRHLSSLGRLFSQEYFRGTGKPRYRPLSAVLYIVSYRLWGLNPFGHHLMKILIHLFNSVLVYLFLRLLVAGRTVPLGAAFLFAVHPVNSEAVNCIAFNDDLLAGCFLLLALIGVRKYDLTLKRGYYCFSCATYLLALLSKEVALVFIPLLLLMRYSFFKPATSKTARGRIWPAWLAITAGYGIVRFLIFPGEKMFSVTPPGWGERLLLAGRVTLQYLRLLLLPVKLSPDYALPLPLLPFTLPLWLIALLCLTLLAVAVKWGTCSRLFLWGAFWIVITLLPLSHFLELPKVLAERYLYIPSIGWTFLLMSAFAKAGPLSTPARAGFSSGQPGEAGTFPGIWPGLIILCFFFLTLNQNRVWQKEESLWKRAITVSPSGPHAHNNLGWCHFQSGNYADAEKEYESVFQFNPSSRLSAVTYTNLAVLFQARGDDKQAWRLLQQARAADPGYVRACRQEGYIFLRFKRYGEAADKLLKVLELNPYDYESCDLLGRLLAELGHASEAEGYFRQAVAINPDYQPAFRNLELLKRIKAK